MIATTAITDHGKSRSEIQRELKAKDKAVKNLLHLFSNEGYGRSSDKGRDLYIAKKI